MRQALLGLKLKSLFKEDARLLDPGVYALVEVLGVLEATPAATTNSAKGYQPQQDLR